MAKVAKPLGSVRAMLEAGNVVVFDKGNCYVQTKASGKRTEIEEVNGSYVFDMWVPLKENNQGNDQGTGRYQCFMDQDDVNFVGQEDLLN